MEKHPGITPIEQAKRKNEENKREGKKERVDVKEARKSTVEGLREAIEATKNRIAVYGSTPDLELHLKNLERQLAEVEQK